jgi:hypothetical protein
MSAAGWQGAVLHRPGRKPERSDDVGNANTVSESVKCIRPCLAGQVSRSQQLFTVGRITSSVRLTATLWVSAPIDPGSLRRTYLVT